MFNKKILIIILLVLILSAVALYFFVQKKTEQPAPAPDQQTDQPTAPSLPIESKQNTKTVSVAATDEDIAKAFTEINSQKPTEPLAWSKIYTSENQLLSLDKFAHATGMILEPQLESLLDPNNYELFACNDAEEGYGHGILMNMRLLPNYQGELYQDEVKFMKIWESSLLRDTAKILFPDYTFTNDQLQQSPNFKDGVYRYTDVLLPDSTFGSINYNLIDDYVLISSSKDCLQKASEYVFSTSD